MSVQPSQKWKALYKAWSSSHEQEKPKRRRCPECGLKIGGPNHASGKDHEDRSNKKK